MFGINSDSGPKCIHVTGEDLKSLLLQRRAGFERTAAVLEGELPKYADDPIGTKSIRNAIESCRNSVDEVNFAAARAVDADYTMEQALRLKDQLRPKITTAEEVAERVARAHRGRDDDE